LDKSIVLLHVDPHQFSKGLKEHLQVFTFGAFFVKIDHKQGFGGRNITTTVIFLAFDASIATSEFDSKSR
jgi:hypothetical protein